MSRRGLLSYASCEGYLKWHQRYRRPNFQRLTVEEEQSDIINSIPNSAGTIPTETDEKVEMSSTTKVTGGVLPIAYHSNEFRRVTQMNTQARSWTTFSFKQRSWKISITSMIECRKCRRVKI